MTDMNIENKVTEVTTERITNKAFDFEYSTQFKREVEFLKERGILPVFKKHTKDYHIPTYKYTKTPELFYAVADFYKQYLSEKTTVRNEPAQKVLGVVPNGDDMNA